MKRLKEINHKHYICIAITIASIACTAFLFTNSINRIIESFRDFGLSVAYYFCEIFHINADITVTVTELPSLSLFPTTGSATVDLPETWTGFKGGFTAYWKLWADMENFTGYLAFLGKLLYNLSYILLLIIPVILIFYILFSRCIASGNNNYNKDSAPLKVFKKITRFYKPLKQWLLSLIDFIRRHKRYYVAWLCIWALNFNMITIFVEFLAYYFYFCMSFDFAGIYMQIYKLACNYCSKFI